MAYKKRKIPEDVQDVQKRIDGMTTIEPELDFGSGVSVVTMKAAVKKVSDGISLLNMKLSEADELGNNIDADIKAMNELSSRALKASEFKYGKDSNEYEKMGGTRASERKKPQKKTITSP
jgi:hypothetical protein